MFREVEPAENHLKDLLQQLTSVTAAKPSDRPTVCQGESGGAPYISRLEVLGGYAPVQLSHNVVVVGFFCVLFPYAEEAEDPACIPIFWISKWVDYSDKYGLGKCWLDPAAIRQRESEVVKHLFHCHGAWFFF